MSFDGKVVIVTGAGSGMGRASALEFGRRGCNVVVADIDVSTAEDATQEICESGGTAVTCEVDLRVKADIDAMVALALARFGQLDVLANVAGVYPTAGVEEMSEELWADVFAIDLEGPLHACKAALPHLRTSRGSIVNVASGAAFYALRGLSAYAAAKAGLVALSRVIALEASPEVRVNTVVPGPTASNDRIRGSLPITPLLGRAVEPEEIADVIVWLTSDAAGAVNGALLRVDGGHAML